MKNVTFISAGAGSGKTYTLTQKIVEMVKNGDCRSDEIILTTFTKVAANELREKVRSALYAAGFYDAAMNIDNAAIGTIHSVAYQFLSRYWYLLGISANVTIMPEENSSFYISQSLSSLPTEDDLLLFDRVFKAFDVKKYDSIRNSRLPYPDFWKDELKSIIEKTVELCISEKQLEKAREDSKKLLEKTIGWNGYEISQDEIGNLIKWTNDLCSTGKLAQDIEKKIKDSLPSVESYDSSKKGNQFPINHLMVLAKAIAAIKTPAIKKDEKYKEIFEKTAEIAEQLPRSKHVSELIEKYIDKIFDLAKQWKSSYEDFKRERCLLDNGDLLQKFYELLNKDEVANDIKSRYKVALVDEFQDCSPLQVESFKLLSDIMEQSIWVGDIKQAIYGFRGSNPELVKTLIGEIKKKENGNKFDSLEHCWRSSVTIVKLVNKVFVKVFEGQIDAKLVELGIPEEERTNVPKEQKLRHWNFEGRRKEERRKLFVDELEKFIEESGYSYKDIAILFRSNGDVKGCAAELKPRGIPYNVKMDNNAKDGFDDVSTFLNAVISFVARNGNELSKAIVANRVENGYSVSTILSDRLSFLADNKEENEMWLSGADVINRLLALRKTVGNQSVSAAVETIVAEINLIDLVKRIDPDTPAYNYCSSLVAKAVAYEDSCSTMGLSSTLLGFASYLQENPISFPGDENGITVMTYHKSKGLEWPCVILCSLDEKVLKEDRAFYGVLTLNTEKETLLRLVPVALKDVFKIDGKSGLFSQLGEATYDEAKRLMYVGMTRPKEQLILVTEGKADDCDLWLKNIGCKSIRSNDGKWYETDVIRVNNIIENADADTAPDSDTEVDDKSSLVPKEFKALKQAEQRETFDDKFVSPSMVKSVGGIYTVEKVADFAGRLTISSLDKKDSTIGNFIHHAMCLWNDDESVLESLAANYDVKVETNKLSASIKSFWKWMEESYGMPIVVERELPFCFTNEKGQVVNGEIDLVYRTEKGDVLVDYKTYQGSPAHLIDENHDFHTGKKYGAQIVLYEDALKRMGRSIRDRLVCYVSLGVIIKMK